MADGAGRGSSTRGYPWWSTQTTSDNRNTLSPTNAQLPIVAARNPAADHATAANHGASVRRESAPKRGKNRPRNHWMSSEESTTSKGTPGAELDINLGRCTLATVSEFGNPATRV